MSEINDKIAMITGAGSGIGKAAAIGLFEAGYKLVLVGRRIEPLNELISFLGAKSDRAIAVSADVRDPESVRSLFAITEETFHRLDVLFNNAGVNAPAVPIDELDLTYWQNTVDTNITGILLCARAAFALMRKQNPQGGRIINNGSISAYTPRPFTAPYTASKHAVRGITRSLALDGRTYNIACGEIDIGNALTDLSQRMTKGVLQANGETAAEPMMDVKHVASAVCYMASLPLSANVLNMTIMATNMPFVGRG
ncbi:SDR family oxidoreductase (plasmid) [Klebsiella sp. WOUb02]|uniref:SDR family oxidoreductase n=1 Tax=Klebsiella sp. WOUb02 TaxID=3161071 RepID=UPI003CE8047A